MFKEAKKRLHSDPSLREGVYLFKRYSEVFWERDDAPFDRSTARSLIEANPVPTDEEEVAVLLDVLHIQYGIFINLQRLGSLQPYMCRRDGEDRPSNPRPRRRAQPGAGRPPHASPHA